MMNHKIMKMNYYYYYLLFISVFIAKNLLLLVLPYSVVCVCLYFYVLLANVFHRLFTNRILCILAFFLMIVIINHWQDHFCFVFVSCLFPSLSLLLYNYILLLFITQILQFTIEEIFARMLSFPLPFLRNVCQCISQILKENCGDVDCHMLIISIMINKTL